MALNRPTVLVLGAGASKDFGLPLGNELKLIIANALHIRFDDWGNSQKTGDREIMELLFSFARERRLDVNSLIHICRKIADSLPSCSSIDDYIEKHVGVEHHEFCGKLGIAKSILDAERSSSIFKKREGQQIVNSATLAESWMSDFMRTITSGVHVSNVATCFDNLTVINFNYDRCFEIFTYNWLQTSYQLSPSEAEVAIRRLNVVHPYGSLGPLFPNQSNNNVPFGFQARSADLQRISSSIRTYSETLDDQNIINAITSAISESKKIVFMGFAFHQQNIRFFELSAPSRPTVRQIYTCDFGISKAKWEIVESRLLDALKMQSEHLYTYFQGESCKKLWEEYSDHIAA